jgi:hypothetical protein
LLSRLSLHSRHLLPSLALFTRLLHSLTSFHSLHSTLFTRSLHSTRFTPHRYQLALTFNSTQFRCLGPVTPLAIPHTASTNNATAGTLIVAGTAGQLSGSSAIVSPAHDGVGATHLHSLHSVECHLPALTVWSATHLHSLHCVECHSLALTVWSATHLHSLHCHTFICLLCATQLLYTLLHSFAHSSGTRHRSSLNCSLSNTHTLDCHVTSLS